VIKFDDLTDPTKVEAWIRQIYAWIDANVLVLSTVVQALIIAAAFLVAWATASKVQKLLERDWPDNIYRKYGKPVALALAPLSLPVVWLILQWVSVLAAEHSEWPHHLIKIVVSLLTAWIVIRLAATLIRNPHWSRTVTVAAWIIAALSITDLLEPTQVILDDLALTIGEDRISVLRVIKAGIALAVLLWLAGFASRLVERRLVAMPDMTPSARVLLGKMARVFLFVLAVVIGLESVGIDLTGFKVFSGAVGLGVGFGLKNVISNLISGMILLMDKSVKPGDVIALGDTYGEIKTLKARYVSVVTRDGTEHLIPNEELISQRVENWSFSSRRVRLRLPIGISYGSDLRKAIELAVEATNAAPRVLRYPPAQCLLRGFGDSSVDLEVRAWIEDPQNGTGSVRNEILLAIWDSFHDNGIEFPYPQREIRILGDGEGHGDDEGERTAWIEDGRETPFEAGETPSTAENAANLPSKGA